MRPTWTRRSSCIALGLLACLGHRAVGAQALDAPRWREDSTPAEQALDAAALEGAAAALAAEFTDVHSAVVALRGRVVFSFYRDGDPGKAHDVRRDARVVHAEERHEHRQGQRNRHDQDRPEVHQEHDVRKRHKRDLFEQRGPQRIDRLLDEL